MLDRVSVSVALTTIIAVLAKLALLYREAAESWFDKPVDQQVVYLLLITIFLVFFRGKMMHDDSDFFRDLESGEAFKSDDHAKARIKTGLLTAYLSWLCWGPVVYFLERPVVLAYWLIISLGFSTLWLLADIATRELPKTDQEAKKRYWFLGANIVYAIPLIVIAKQVVPSAIAAGALVLILFLDWIVSDTFGPFA